MMRDLPDHFGRKANNEIFDLCRRDANGPGTSPKLAFIEAFERIIADKYSKQIA
jgi:hypothetical protein